MGSMRLLITFSPKTCFHIKYKCFTFKIIIIKKNYICLCHFGGDLKIQTKNKRDIMTKNSNFCEFMSFFVKVGRELCAVSPAAVPGNQLGVQNQPRHRQTPDRKEINVFTSLKVRFKLIFYSLFDKKFN
jgi:hypothetical protein